MKQSKKVQNPLIKMGVSNKVEKMFGKSVASALLTTPVYKYVGEDLGVGDMRNKAN